ncbi:MAG: 23S rRNA (adenine(2030)-N(6))-methyltransferase RlmJ [Gammaproteobacteria bacterium]|nr:23S rRNA (adenine(2030)-N(6))-methyltransferase RlmJ [Gammaproteobacteria bacterium]
MLSYRHGFHAGNGPDVFKHIVLAELIAALQRKDGPICYLDTHAGAGRYDLESAMARKNGEFRAGIGRVWGVADVPRGALRYLDAVRALNEGDAVRWYPGSPLLVRHLLRAQDRMVLCELHTTEIKVLGTVFAGDKQVGVHHLDGYQGLKAFLPPRERRGLVLCDPAFEVKDERERLIDAIRGAWLRWPTGVFAIWHPIQDRKATERLYRAFRESGIRKVLRAELCTTEADADRKLLGSGLLIINPPWKLDRELASALPWLWQALSVQGRGQWLVDWLLPE